MEEFLRADLPRIAAAAPAEAAWHLRPRCTSCAFFHHCRAEADRTDDLSRVVGLTPLAKRELNGARHPLRPRAAQGGVPARRVRGVPRAGIRRGHAQEARAGAGLRQDQGRGEAELSHGRRRVHPRAADGGRRPGERDGVRAGPQGGARQRARRHRGLSGRGRVGGRGAGDADRASCCAPGRGLRGGRGVARRGRWRQRGQKAAHVFVWDRGEAELLRECLQRHLGDPGTQPGIAGVSRLLFPAGDAGGSPPGTVVLDVVSELFALPIPYAWDLASVSAELQPSEGAAVHLPRADYGWPLSSQVAYERIHNVWSGRPYRADGEEQAPDEVRARDRADGAQQAGGDGFRHPRHPRGRRQAPRPRAADGGGVRGRGGRQRRRHPPRHAGEAAPFHPGRGRGRGRRHPPAARAPHAGPRPPLRVHQRAEQGRDAAQRPRRLRVRRGVPRGQVPSRRLCARPDQRRRAHAGRDGQPGAGCAAS